MKPIFRLVSFEFALVRVLLFRIIFERMLNTLIAAVAGFAAVFLTTLWDNTLRDIQPTKENIASLQAMILFAFLYAETIMANWQYTINKTGRMEVIFNSTQPPLLIILVKTFASACVTLLLLTLIYTPPLAWFGLMGVFNSNFLFTAAATLIVCCCVMCFNAIFEFRVKQVKALTSTLNLVFPYLATRYAADRPDSFGFIPYFNGAKFISLGHDYGVLNVLWLFFTAAVTASVFLLAAQMIISRIRATASVYLE
jgi:hypothetical protein